MNCKKMTHVIVDTDWWTDCDDVAAMRVLSWAQREGLVYVDAVTISACMEYSAPSLSAFLTAEGLGNVPLGLDHLAVNYGKIPLYQKTLAAFPNTYPTNDHCEDAVCLLRQKLSATKEQVDIIEIGYPQVLAGLLRSTSDEINPEAGIDLVKSKVRKLWMMAGNWENENSGLENNFARNSLSRESSSYLCRNWPTPVTFLGFEVGEKILTGGNLRSEDDLLYLAMKTMGFENGRSSWDPMLMLMACIGDEKEAGYSRVCGTASVDSTSGINFFQPGDGLHCYVKKVHEDQFYQTMINQILAQRP